MENNKMSVYSFAKKVIGCQPQQLYQMINNGSFPEELYDYEQVGERTQPMVKVEEAKAWFASRKQGNISEEAMVEKVISLIDNEKLAAQVRKYFEAKKAQA